MPSCYQATKVGVFSANKSSVSQVRWISIPHLKDSKQEWFAPSHSVAWVVTTLGAALTGTCILVFE